MHSSGLAELLGGSQILYSSHEGGGAEAEAFIKTSAGLCIFTDLQVQGA